MKNVIIAQDPFDEVVTDEVLHSAIQRGLYRPNIGLHAHTLQYIPALKSLKIGFADHSAVMLPIKNYPELASLDSISLSELTLGFGGSALCLEARDLHVSIAGLVAASVPLMAMATVLVASRNGSQSSAVKTSASRENGKKGGRPRKVVATC